MYSITVTHKMYVIRHHRRPTGAQQSQSPSLKTVRHSVSGIIHAKPFDGKAMMRAQVHVGKLELSNPANDDIVRIAKGK